MYKCKYNKESFSYRICSPHDHNTYDHNTLMIPIRIMSSEIKEPIEVFYLATID